MSLAHLFWPRESNNHKPVLLYPRSIFAFVAAFLLLQVILNRPQISPSILGYASDINIQQIIDFTNQKRAQSGLDMLQSNSELSQAAASKANHMFAHDYWAHVAPDGTEPWYFITQSGYRYLVAGENLARDFDDSASVVEAWMNSPSHKDNLLSPRYQDIGVAVVNGQLAGVETTLVVQMFGTQLLTGPKVSDSSAVAPVQAAESTPLPTQITPVPTTAKLNAVTASYPTQPKINPFRLTRGISSLLLIVIIALFAVDIIIIWKNKIIRLSSDSAAHVIFLISILACLYLINSGLIL